MSIAADYRFCASIIKKSSRSFYRAFSLLPAPKRNAVFAIYAFCRQCDDAIDLASDIRALDELENGIKLLREGKIADSPVFRSLADAASRYRLDWNPFLEQIEGQRMDLTFSQPGSQSDLERYCYYVAGTVGLMILPIIATERCGELREQAIALGIAMQITNILRDVGEDYANGRVYLPSEVLRSNGAAVADIGARTVTGAFVKAWEYEAAIAERYYQGFLADTRLFDRDSIKAVLGSALYYRAILDAVRENGHDCLNKRAFVKKLPKIPR